MATNLFEESRASEGTKVRGSYEVGETTKGNVPEQIKASDLTPGDPGPNRDESVRADIESTRSAGVKDARSETSSDTRPARHLRSVVSAGSLIGDRVRNGSGEHLGSIEQIMIDLATGGVAYAVLSFGGFLGIGDKLFAVPWNAIRFDEGEQEFVLDVSKEKLENAPGFDKSAWPDMADPTFGQGILTHYGQSQSGSSPQIRTYVHDTTDAGDYIGDNTQSNRSMEYEPTTGYRK